MIAVFSPKCGEDLVDGLAVDRSLTQQDLRVRKISAGRCDEMPLGLVQGGRAGRQFPKGDGRGLDALAELGVSCLEILVLA